MKKYLIILIFICFSFSIAQTYKIQNKSFSNEIKFNINLNLVDHIIKNNKIFFPEYDNYSKSGDPNIPSQIIYVALPEKAKISQLDYEIKESSLINNTFISANSAIKQSSKDEYMVIDEEINPKYFKYSQYPLNVAEIKNYKYIGNYYCAIIEISPYIYNFQKRSLQEIHSLNIQIKYSEGPSFTNYSSNFNRDKETNLSKLIVNYNDAKQFRIPDKIMKQADNDWLNYNYDYLKLSISNDNIYRIYKSDFTNWGINSQFINPINFKIYIKGEEIPIYVSGGKDGVFDDGDFIEFYAEKNYESKDYTSIVNKGETYKNYLNRYSDTTVIWLTWDGNAGKRIIEENSNFISSDTLNFSTGKIHLEQDKKIWYYDAVQPRTQLPFYQEHKVWTWYYIPNTANVKIDFNLNQLVPNTPLKVNARMISHSADIINNAHAYVMSANSTNYNDTIRFNYTETINFEREFSSEQFNNGANYIRIKSIPTEANFHQSLVDWVDITYSQNNIAENDSLILRFEGSNLNKILNINISNITSPLSDLVLYRIEPTPKRINNIKNYNSNEIVFSDTIFNGSKYIIKKNSNVTRPKFLEKKIFVNLRDKNNSCEYLIISHKSLTESVTEYADYINDYYNKNVFTAYVNDIYDEFGAGQVGAEPIKDFIKYAFNNWKEPKLKYLVLIGDANYDYKDVVEPAPTIRKKNLVPSFGYPVSDVWYTLFEELNENFQQIFVGRIPVSSNQELNRYLVKHKNYNDRKYDIWNKRYLLFSGGDPKKPYELLQVKNANDFIKDNLINPAPIGGLSTHFYKTSDPVTNFGPYSSEKISYEIGEGGMFISYLGHSGTQTWDNGVTSVSDIKSNYSDRYPLITDFGCSTGKFAEPDVDSYSELAVNLDKDGEAIAYLGNTSLGYLSSALNFPSLFYEQLLLDSLVSIGEVHAIAKQKLFQKSGISDVTRVFNYCNNLFGDPIIKIKIPDKPNFTIPIENVKLPTNVSDNNESFEFSFKVKNLGKVQNDSVKIKITDLYNSEIDYSVEIKILIPLYEEIIKLTLPVSKKLGEHSIELFIDYENLITEIYEDDNSQKVNYTIFSSSVRPILYDPIYSLVKDEIKFINPIYSVDDNSLSVRISQDQSFGNVTEISLSMDTVISKLKLDEIEQNKKYYLQTKLKNEGNWGPIYSIKSTNDEYDWMIDDSFILDEKNLFQTEYDSTFNGWKLTKKVNNLKITSAGFNEGSYGSVIYDLEEKLPNTFFWGIAVATLDSISLIPREINIYKGLPREPNEDSLINFLSKIPEGTLTLFVVSNDAAQSVLGFNNGTKSREKIKEFGSFYIDSVKYRQSWCMLGKKGAPIGSVPEVYHKLFEGPAVIDTSVLISYNYGEITTPTINNFSVLNKVKLESSMPPGTTININPIIETSSGGMDTLGELMLVNDLADLNFMNSEEIKSVKFKLNLKSQEPNVSPIFNSLSLSYLGKPELATNYQVVSIKSDSVQQGEDVNLQFYIYNVGESTADSIRVNVDLVEPDNSRKQIFTSLVDSIGAGEKRIFDVNYNTINFNGARNFTISIDPENKIKELFEDNNYYSIPFFVKGDTTHPTLNITFDGNDIFDGEFISAEPKIRIELNDPSLIPITDTNSVNIYLNNKRINYNNNSQMNINFSNNNPKVIVEYNPQLEDGEYRLRVFAKDASGNIADSSGFTKLFNVVNETKILDVYNYPNPFDKNTYFTFKLTQIPDEIKIKVFTIVGRLVKEIKLNSSELNFDLNKVYWDGKDSDGDILANGVYIYKIIMEGNGKKQDITSKLAIVR